MPDENNNGGNHSQKPKETASPTLKKRGLKRKSGYGTVYGIPTEAEIVRMRTFGIRRTFITSLCFRMVLMADMIPLMMR